MKFLLSLILLCDTNTHSGIGHGTPTAAMLINKQWTMFDYGFDENLNGKLDRAESRIEACEKDDTYEFFKDGSGLAKSNSFSCCNGLDEQYFRWQVKRDDKTLWLFSEEHTITRLTKDELITYRKLSYIKGQTTRLITIYKTSNTSFKTN